MRFLGQIPASRINGLVPYVKITYIVPSDFFYKPTLCTAQLMSIQRSSTQISTLVLPRYVCEKHIRGFSVQADN